MFKSYFFKTWCVNHHYIKSMIIVSNELWQKWPFFHEVKSKNNQFRAMTYILICKYLGKKCSNFYVSKNCVTKCVLIDALCLLSPFFIISCFLLHTLIYLIRSCFFSFSFFFCISNLYFHHTIIMGVLKKV